MTPSAQFTIPILTDAGHGTTCSYELGATAGAIGDEATFKVERWDAEAVPPAFVAEPSLGPTAGAVAAGDVLTEVWVPQAVGTYKFTLDGTTETVEVKVTNAVDILGFVCILLPEM
ncbi:MAG: hypothetical protein GX610_05490 [Rhodococcus sp.]|nr:hypothetical protein [Rhodococcus sp. (in: high G+C Gram-positive bacteria)]